MPLILWRQPRTIDWDSNPSTNFHDTPEDLCVWKASLGLLSFFRVCHGTQVLIRTGNYFWMKMIHFFHLCGTDFTYGVASLFLLASLVFAWTSGRLKKKKMLKETNGSCDQIVTWYIKSCNIFLLYMFGI